MCFACFGLSQRDVLPEEAAMEHVLYVRTGEQMSIHILHLSLDARTRNK